MADKGIFRYTGFKRFLTQGLFRKIFQPIFFNNAEHIHNSFLNPLVDCLRAIKDNVQKDKQLILSFWLIRVPRELFEEIFIDGDKPNELMSFATKNADNLKAEKCTYITQAYVLWTLEQFLENDKIFQNKIDLTIEQIEYVLKDILKFQDTLNYLNFFRKEFDLEKLHKDNENFIDPRDWILFYVWQICEVIYSDKNLMKQTLKDWDNNMLKKMSLTIFDTEYFTEVKNISSNLITKK